MPLLDGTGTSSKTLEAIEFGKPLLSTEAGLRGLGMTAEAAMPNDFGDGWAEMIMTLLGEPRRLRALAQEQLKAVTGPSMEASLLHILAHMAKSEAADPLPPAPLAQKFRAK